MKTEYDEKNLADAIVLYRAKHGLSQRKFAEKAGVSLQTICSMENGLQSPTRLTEAKIRLVLDADKKEEE